MNAFGRRTIARSKLPSSRSRGRIALGPFRMVCDDGSAYHASNPRMLGGAMEGIAPILHVADARASVDWYAQLGFEVESEHAFGPDWPLYVRLRRGPAQLHLSEHRLDGGPASHIYLYAPAASALLVGEQVGEPDAAVAPGLVERDLPGFQESHQRGPRHAQQTCGLAGGQDDLMRCHGNGQPLRVCHLLRTVTPAVAQRPVY